MRSTLLASPGTRSTSLQVFRKLLRLLVHLLPGLAFCSQVLPFDCELEFVSVFSESVLPMWQISMVLTDTGRCSKDFVVTLPDLLLELDVVRDE